MRNECTDNPAAAAKQEPGGDAQLDSAKLTQSEAKALMAWQDLGQKDGVKTHILTFYENQADKDAKRGRMTVATVSMGDRSANAWTVDGDDKTFGALSLAKKRAEEIGMAKAVADGYVERLAAGREVVDTSRDQRIGKDINGNDVFMGTDGALRGVPYIFDERGRPKTGVAMASAKTAAQDAPPINSISGRSVPLLVGQRLATEAIANEVEQRIGQFAHQPRVLIRDRAEGVLPGATDADGVAGAVHKGVIFLFRDQLATGAEVRATLFHELLHYGLRRIFSRAQFIREMQSLYERDAWVKARADAWATSADGRRAALYGGEEYATARGVDEALARLTVEPRKDGGADVHILSNAYDAPGFTPFARWFREGLGRLVDQKKFPAVLGDSGLQLSSSTWQNKPGMRNILTEKHLDGYRRKNSPAAMSRTVQPLRTPATTIRASITKAYGKLLGQLEAKGLVTLTQTQEQAIEAAAQARADKTGQPLAEVRASLMGSVSNSKRVTRDVRAVLSQADKAGTDVVEVTFGTVDPALAGLIQSKTRKDVGGFEHSMDSSAVRHARNEHGDARKEAARGQIAITDDDLRTAPQVIFAADRYVLGAKDRQGNDLVGYVKQMPDGTVLYVEEVRTGRKTLAFKSIRKYAATSNVDAVAKTLSLNARSDGGISIVDARSLDMAMR